MRSWTRSVRVVCSVVFICAVISSVSSQQQAFREAPADVSFIQDQTAIIKCRVDNLKGAVQWTKNHFALGYDRNIPAFPRYSVIGNEALGEFDLMIKDVKLEDDGEYQCQVNPAGGDNALRGSATFSVLIPPQPPQILGYTNGSLVKVPHQQPSLNLTCVAAMGKPAATITWLKGNEEITEGVQHSVAELGNKLQNATSVLTFVPADADDGSVYRCQANNDALIKAAETRVHLSVLHPPGPPEITGYRDGQVVKTTETLKLKCISRGGNPLAQVYWYKNDAELDFSFAEAGNTVENELVFQVQPNDMNAIYKCEASNLVTPVALKSQVKLTVQFAPTKVTISGHKQVKMGDTVKLKCVSDISNPPAVITWSFRGREMSGAKNKTKESPLGGFITTSEISVVVENRENEVEYQCSGTNEALGKTVEDRATLQVMYPPGEPEIVGYTEGRTVTAGQIQTMTCTSKGGNPLANVTWWKGEKLIPTQSISAWNMVQSTLTFILKSDDNQAQYRCNATNEATATPLLKSVKLNVNFPPSSINITTEPPQIKAGEKVVITCQSSSSNPASSLTWFKDGEEVRGINVGIIDSEHFGKSTISKLELTPPAEENEKIYACKATNSLIERAVSDAITLDVLFKPKFGPQVPSSLDIVEGESGVLNFTVLANPADVTYNWFKDGTKVKFGKPKKRKREVSLPHIIMDNGVLTITKAKKTDSGFFTLKAKNNEGSTEFNFTLNVQYAAKIQKTTKKLTVESGVNATLECVVDGNPLPPGSVVWQREGYDMSRTVNELSGSKSTLTIFGAVKDDCGEFTCIANNGIGDESKGVAQLVVKFAPEIDKTPALSKFAADNGTTAQLRCVAKGAPKITFKWMKGGTELDTTGNKYKVKDSEEGLVIYQSELSVLNTAKSDYGPYVCMATNELGNDNSEIKLDGTSIPDSPYELRFVNSTHNSMTLTWKPGFNGGSPQSFQVRYHEIHLAAEGETEVQLPAYKYEDVIPQDATTFTVTSLKLATMYEMSVRGINKLGPSEYSANTIKMSTSAVAPVSSGADEMPLYIILTVVIIGLVLLGLNVLLILLFIRKRKMRMEKDSETTSQANTVEMFNAPTITEDSKSYTSYNFDDDEFCKPFDDDEEMKKFLPPNTYIGSEGPYPSLQRRGVSPYITGPLPPPDYRSLPKARPNGTGGVYPVSGNGVYPGAGSREGIIMDDYAAVASGLGPKPSLDPYGISSLPRRDPDGAYMDSMSKDPDRPYTDSIRKSQQSLPSMHMDPSSQLALPQTQPPRSMKPAPPTRSSSRGSTTMDGNLSNKPSMPPVPSRHYASEEVPRYAPPPESTVRNSRGHLTNRPPPPPPPDMRGHLV